MARPKTVNDKDILRLILESEHYNPNSGKWTSHLEAREWMSFKLKTSEATVNRTIRSLVNRGILEPTKYRGIYYINEKLKNKVLGE